MLTRLLLLLTLSALANTVSAENYYCVSTTGTKTTGVSTTDIDAFGWANADCYPSPWTAAAVMSSASASGAQMWINDGDYDRTTGTAAAIPITTAMSGSSGDYTIIKARNPGEVTISSSVGSGIHIRGASYIYVEGIHVDLPINASGAAIYILDSSGHAAVSSYVTIKRCSFMGDATLVTAGSHHILVEDCFGYGGPMRYPFQTSNGGYNTQYVVFRRCLVRWDWSNVSDPQACFANYSTDHVYFQNCIAVDCTDNKGNEMPAFDGSKGFFTPNGGDNVGYVGCMVVAGTGFGGFHFEGSPLTNVTMDNCLVWNLDTNSGDATDTYLPIAIWQLEDIPGVLTVTSSTFGAVDYDTQHSLAFDNLGGETMFNSIVYGMGTANPYYAVGPDLDDSGYNLYYANAGGRNKADGTEASDITDVDPTASGLFYKTQIEPCSYCQTAGESGTQIGAQIRTKIGVDGTYYGDTGWDLDTGAPLWPFPYEDTIRERCASFYSAAGAAYSIAGGDSYDSPEMIGARGFCSGSWTLSSYLRAGGE